MAPLQRSQQAPLCLMTRAQSLESTGHFSLLHVTSLFWKKKLKDKSYCKQTKPKATISCNSEDKMRGQQSALLLQERPL